MARYYQNMAERALPALFARNVSTTATFSGTLGIERHFHLVLKLSEGGEEGPCSWLKDRCGLSWQVCPVGMNEMLNDPDPARGQRAMAAMLSMQKIDLAALYAAADNRGPK